MKRDMLSITFIRSLLNVYKEVSSMAKEYNVSNVKIINVPDMKIKNYWYNAFAKSSNVIDNIHTLLKENNNNGGELKVVDYNEIFRKK